MHEFLHDLGTAYTVHILHAGKEGQFIVLATFLVTFTAIRLITNAVRRGNRLFRNVWIQGHHVHHLVPGILLLLVSGYLSIALRSRVGTGTTAVLFGIGAALTLDEFALWLHLRDVYWEREGRRSIDAVILAALIGGLTLLGSDFWVDLFRVIRRDL